MKPSRAKSTKLKSPPPDQPAVFVVTNPLVCDECKTELLAGDFLSREGLRNLCTACADLDYLQFLKSGDVALTRRASKYSSKTVLVLRWSRARKQYERQGLLVEEQAIERAEVDCFVDADLRESRRKREEEKRKIIDREYIVEFEKKILSSYPSCPADVAGSIALHACCKHSGRVGRSAAAKEFDPRTITLAVRAHIRHNYTKYDELLSSGVPRAIAREEVEAVQEQVLGIWRRK